MNLLQIINRNCADSSTDSNDEVLKLKQRVRTLQSQLSAIRDEAKSKEEILQNLLKGEVQKCLKLQTDLEIAHKERSKAENELEHARQDQQTADVSIKQVQASAHDLSKIAATDREWLENEMSRRSAVTKATKQKCQSELARMKRGLSLHW